MSPLENLIKLVITHCSSFFFSLLMANNSLAYPLLKTRGRWDDGKQAALNELQLSCSFLAMALLRSCRPVLEERLCRAIIPRLIFSRQNDRLLTGAFIYLHGPSTLGMGSLRGIILILLAAYRYQRIEYSI